MLKNHQWSLQLTSRAKIKQKVELCVTFSSSLKRFFFCILKKQCFALYQPSLAGCLKIRLTQWACCQLLICYRLFIDSKTLAHSTGCPAVKCCFSIVHLYQLIQLNLPGTSVMLVHSGGCEYLHSLMLIFASILNSNGLQVRLDLLETRYREEVGFATYYERTERDSDFAILVFSNTAGAYIRLSFLVNSNSCFLRNNWNCFCHY